MSACFELMLPRRNDHHCDHRGLGSAHVPNDSLSATRLAWGMSEVDDRYFAIALGDKAVDQRDRLRTHDVSVESRPLSPIVRRYRDEGREPRKAPVSVVADISAITTFARMVGSARVPDSYALTETRRKQFRWRLTSKSDLTHLVSLP